MKKRIGIIGSGSIVPYHIEAIQKLDSSVYSIASRPGSKSTLHLANKYNIENVFKTGIDLIRNSKNLDGLILCTPPNVVFEILSYATSLEIPILIEKPGMVESKSLSKYKNSSIFFAYNRRFYQTVNSFKKSINGSKGLYCIKIIEDKSCLVNKNLLLETIKNNSIHYIDLLHFIYGIFRIGNITLLHGEFGFEVEIIDLNNKKIGYFYIEFGTPSNSSVTFENSELFLALKPLERFSRSNYIAVSEPNEERKIRSYWPIWRPENHKSEIFEDFRLKPGFELQMKDFLSKEYSSVQVKSDLADLDDAIFAFEIVEEICEKIRWLSD